MVSVSYEHILEILKVSEEDLKICPEVLGDFPPPRRYVGTVVNVIREMLTNLPDCCPFVSGSLIRYYNLLNYIQKEKIKTAALVNPSQIFNKNLREVFVIYASIS